MAAHLLILMNIALVAVFQLHCLMINQEVYGRYKWRRLVDQIITKNNDLYAKINTGNSFLDTVKIISIDNLENRTYNKV